MQVIHSLNKFFLLYIILFIAASLSFAQENLKEKISKISSDVEKITITAGGEEYTFEGKDAEKLFKRIKANKKSKSYSFNIDEESEGGEKTIIIKSLGDGDECHKLIHHGSNDLIWFEDESDSGFKKIKIITNGDKEEIYEFESEKDGDMEWFGDSENKMSKKMKIEINDGVKKVTVTTVEDGEESTKVYEGEEADKFLEDMKSEHGEDMHIEFFDDDGNKKLEKIIIEKNIKKEKTDK